MVLLASCNNQSSGEKYSGVLSPKDVNSSLRIWMIEEKTVFDEGSPISFFIQNASDNRITAPGDFNLQLYEYEIETQEWIEIANLGGQVSQPITLELPNNYFMNSIIPDISKSELTTRVLIVSTGIMEKNDGLENIEVGAYEEVLIKKK